MNTVTPTVIRTTSGGRICTTEVTLDDGYTITFLERPGKREAVRQAKYHQRREWLAIDGPHCPECGRPGNFAQLCAQCAVSI